MDPQRWQLSKHSSTATRLSQKLLVSDTALHPDWDMISLDVSNAFLEGFGFELLERICKSLGIQLPDVQREIYIVVPDNVWFLLRQLGQSGLPKGLDLAMWCIRLTKAMYGLNGGPFYMADLSSLLLRAQVLCVLQLV